MTNKQITNRICEIIADLSVEMDQAESTGGLFFICETVKNQLGKLVVDIEGKKENKDG